MVSRDVTICALLEGAKCFLLVMCILALMIGREDVSTQESTKTQIADTETTGLTLTLFMSLLRRICL